MRGLKTIIYAIQNWFQLKCTLLSRHHYVLDKKYNEDILKLHCKKCHKQFGVDLKSALIFTWDKNMMLALATYEQNLKDDERANQASIANVRMKVVI